MSDIRTVRGRWSPLSPCFLWPIETEYKKYPSLLNFLHDNSLITPSRLLFEKKSVKREKIIVKLRLVNGYFSASNSKNTGLFFSYLCGNSFLL